MTPTLTPGTREQVTAFSRWERELPKLMGDPRFGAVASTKDRRALFDEFCKEVGSAARAGSKPGKKGELTLCPAWLRQSVNSPLPAPGICGHLAQRLHIEPTVNGVSGAPLHVGLQL